MITAVLALVVFMIPAPGNGAPVPFLGISEVYLRQSGSQIDQEPGCLRGPDQPGPACRVPC